MGLGRGLDALLTQNRESPPARPTMSPPAPHGTARPNGNGNGHPAVTELELSQIKASPLQPRKRFADEGLASLAESIRDHGVLQPVIVRKAGAGYELVAGERRFRAATKLKLAKIPARVITADDEKTLELALIENIQREDLNPIEQAMAFKQIIEENHFTQEQLSEKIGKDRSTIANALRLLRLPNEVRRQVVAGALSMGHARALLALDDDEHMVKEAREILKRGLSVREVERRVKVLRDKAEPAEKVTLDPYEAIPGGKSAVLRETEALTKRYGTRVRIQVSGRRGRVEIDFASPDELERVLSLLKGD